MVFKQKHIKLKLVDYILLILQYAKMPQMAADCRLGMSMLEFADGCDDGCDA